MLLLLTSAQAYSFASPRDIACFHARGKAEKACKVDRSSEACTTATNDAANACRPGPTASPQAAPVMRKPAKVVQSDKPCFAARRTARKDCNGMPGCQIPICNRFGMYRAVQSDGSTGYSWCVTLEGKKIGDESRGLTNKKCRMLRRSRTVEKKPIFMGTVQMPKGEGSEPCFTARAKAAKSCKGMCELPSCNRLGTYRALQINYSTGYGWCVTLEGKKISEESRGLSNNSCRQLRKEHRETVQGGHEPPEFMISGMLGANPDTYTPKKYSKDKGMLGRNPDTWTPERLMFEKEYAKMEGSQD